MVTFRTLSLSGRRLAWIAVLGLAAQTAQAAQPAAVKIPDKNLEAVLRAELRDVKGDLTEAQLAYAASDVLHLHALKDKLEALLRRENRLDLAEACFDFLPTRARLDLAGWNGDVFSHE